ncbi:MAG: isoprenylcysteine carboxylmethyltransferase family protein, partial [Candidatus Binatia bacterium]
MKELIYPAAIVFFMVAALVWPTLRTWRREGLWPVVFHREAAPVQRLLGALLTAFFVGLVAWGFMVALLEPESLGIIPLPPAAASVGWTMMAVGTALVLLAQRHMGSAWRVGIDDRRTELVTSGLFGLCRNPIFTGMLM